VLDDPQLTAHGPTLEPTLRDQANDSDILRFSRDTYCYMWPRDAALVVYALDLAGYGEAARRFYRLCAEIIDGRGFFLHMIAGVLYLVAGLFMIQNPVEAALGLTILVAVCLLVGGIIRIVMSVFERFEGWGWVFVNGLVSVLLGAAIWRQWPLSGFWVIGLFVGIEMFLSGLSWLMLGLALRPASKQALST